MATTIVASEVRSLEELAELASCKPVKIATSVVMENATFFVEVNENALAELLEDAWAEGYRLLAMPYKDKLFLQLSVEGYGWVMQPSGSIHERVAPIDNI